VAKWIGLDTTALYCIIMYAIYVMLLFVDNQWQQSTHGVFLRGNFDTDFSTVPDTSTAH
jgi:hypothetical protein